jgi:hypothetical protein
MVGLTNYDGSATTVTDGASFGPGAAKTTITNYTPNSSSWLLGLFNHRKISEGSTSQFTEYSFDGATGFLRCVRNRANAAADGDTDAVVVYEPDARGFPDTEKWFGGDEPGFPAPAGCYASGSPRYSLRPRVHRACGARPPFR